MKTTCPKNPLPIIMTKIKQTKKKTPSPHFETAAAEGCVDVLALLQRGDQPLGHATTGRENCAINKYIEAEGFYCLAKMVTLSNRQFTLQSLLRLLPACTFHCSCSSKFLTFLLPGPYELSLKLNTSPYPTIPSLHLPGPPSSSVQLRLSYVNINVSCTQGCACT
jgi:hypothetical protein